MLLNNSSSSR
jgi:hypothetical protein